MRRAIVGAALSLFLVAPAGATSPAPPPALLSVAADGTAAALIDGTDLALGSARGFGTATPLHIQPVDPYGSVWVVAEPGGTARVLWVVAEPGGTARVLWVAERSDYAQPDPPKGLALISSGPGGPEQVSPILPETDELGFDVAADPQGDVVATWPGGAATAAAGTHFTPVTGDTPAEPRAAVASGGRAIIVGAGAGGLAVRERAPGGAFGDAVAIPGSAGVTDYRAALASDGAALIAGARGADVLALERPAGAWDAPIVLGSQTPGRGVAPAVGVGRGGAGVVEFDDATTFDDEIHELPGDGTAGRSTTLPGRAFYARQALAVRDDGSAALLTSGGLVQRAPGQAFGAPAAMSGNALVLGPAGPLLGSEYTTFDLTYAGIRTTVAPVPVDGDGVVILPPLVRVRVPAGPVRAFHTHALVPLVCSGVRVRCDVHVGGQERTFDGGTGAFADVPVRSAATHVTFVLRDAAGTRRRTRRLVRGPDRRPCRLLPWATTVARSGDYRLANEYEGGAVAVLGCGPGAPRQHLANGVAGPADVEGSRVAMVVGDYKLVTGDIATGMKESHVLYAGYNPYRRVVRTVRLAQDGTAVLVERIDHRIRIRAVSGDDDRVLDAAPRIDPASLAVDGNSVSWTRAGVRQSATV